MEWYSDTVTVFSHPVQPPRKNDPGYGLSEGKEMRGGPGKKDGAVLRDSHCIYHPVLPLSKSDPGYGLSEGKENAGRPE